MDHIKIHIRNYSIAVIDDADDLYYDILIDQSHGILYKSSTLIIPHISDMIDECTRNEYRQLVIDQHEYIKANIKKFNDMVADLPVLTICNQPQAGYENIIEYNDISYSRLQVDNFSIIDKNCHLYVTYNTCSIRFTPRNDESFYIKITLIITDEPYDEQRFFDAFKSYFDDHIRPLANIFKPMKCKSANKLN